MAVSLLILAGTAPITAGEVVPAAADAVAIGQVDQIRRMVGVDSDALVALRVNEDQARRTVTACKEWAQANLAQCHLLRQAIVARQRELRETIRQIRVGPAEPEHARTLAGQRESLANARQAYVAFVRAGAGPLVDACLTTAQQERRLVLLANEGLPMPYRAISLTDQQKRKLGQARRQLRQTARVARSQDQRQAAIEAFEVVRAETLSPTQQSELIELQEAMAASSITINGALAVEALAPATQQ